MLLVQLAVTARRAPGDSRACSGRKETKDPEASLDSLDPSACKVCPAPPVRKERMEMWDQWVELVLLVHEVLRVQAAPAELKALPVVSVHLEELVKRERLVNQATPARLESPALAAVKVRLERRARLGPREPLDQQEVEAHPETTAPKETPARLDSQETPVPLVSPALAVSMVFLVTREMTEKLDSLVLLVHLVKLEYRDPLANGDPPEKPDRRAGKERREPRVKLELKESLVKLDQWDLRDLLEKPELRV